MKKCAYLIGIALFAAMHSMAANIADTSKPLLALTKPAEPAYILKEANIVFPDILKGNEEQSVDYIEKFCKSRRDYLIRTYTKGKKMFPKITPILKKYDVPAEFRVLMALESAFNPNAVSNAGAVGYWQIMDEVAKEYNLKFAPQMTPAEKKKLMKTDAKSTAALLKEQAKQKDDRKNFNKSTHAAARYLKDRRRNLNDNWLLVVASYNCGVGNVWDAIDKSGKTNPTFWDIKKFLPAETQAYVMNFITMNVIFNNYDKFTNNSLTFHPEKIILPDNFERNMLDAINESSTSGIQ